MNEYDNECLESSGKILCLPFWEGEEGEGIHNEPSQDQRKGKGFPQSLEKKMQ